MAVTQTPEATGGVDYGVQLLFVLASNNCVVVVCAVGWQVFGHPPIPFSVFP